MKLYIAIFSILLFVSCNTNKVNNMTEYPFFVGTYTNGDSQGIYKYVLHKNGKLEQIGLAAKSDNPSFLTISSNKKYLIAINETNHSEVGKVESFLISDDTLKFISRRSSGGAHPCFVAINNSGYVVTANYTGGNVGLLKLDNNGRLSEILDLQQHYGDGGTKRQKSPHAHSVWFQPNSNKVISIDLGTNELIFSQLDIETNKLISTEQNNIKMSYGAGPRHLAFHPNNKWIFVVNELNSTVTQIRITESGNYEKGFSVSTLPTNYTESNTCADIHISNDGKFLYASNRGQNSIAIFEINENDGTLNYIGYELTRGDGPRNFSLSPNNSFLVVANQHTNNIISFKRDKKTGLLKFASEIDAPTPVCILF